MNNHSTTPQPEIDNDDEPVGRVLSRREVLALFGITGAMFLGGYALNRIQPSLVEAETKIDPDKLTFLPSVLSNRTATVGPMATAIATASPTPLSTATLAPSFTPTSIFTATATPVAGAAACVVSPALTEGPFFVDEKLNRSDIRANTSNSALRPGVLFNLGIRVSRISNGNCAILQGAQVDIWHADGAGEYSDVNGLGMNTIGQNWLRGYQVTNSNGIVNFVSIYPGWYISRATHIHFKIRVTLNNKNYEFTSQMFCDDSLNDAVYAANAAIYNHSGTRVRNTNDSIYNQGGANRLMLNPIASNGGYSAFIDVGMQIT